MGYFFGGLFAGMTDFFIKLFTKKVMKVLTFSGYLLFLVAVLEGVKDFALANIDTSAFMTPTICYFLTKFHAFSLLASYFAFASANWFKAKIVQFWTNKS